MIIFWFILYNGIVMPFLFATVFVISLYQKKMRTSIIGRLKALRNIKHYIKNKKLTNNIYWFHVSSLGEFYQLKPILEGIRKSDGSHINLVSFSSPSGYENAKSNALDFKFYIPIDFFWTVSKILKTIKPKKIIFVAYDLWPNLVWLAKYNNIHTTIFALHFKKKSFQSKPIIKSFYKTLYESLDSIYTVSDNDVHIINRIISKSNNTTIKMLGNPRYDMVVKNADIFKSKKNIFKREKRIILGSTHHEDDSMIIPSITKLIKEISDLKILHVPHEPKKDRIDKINSDYISLGHNPIILKTIDNFKLPQDQIVILNTVGHLANLYWLGQIAYIGGGMSTGIHNVMEPAIAGLPVLFGPKYDHAPEAEELLSSKGGFCVNNKDEFEKNITEIFYEPEKFDKASKAAKKSIYDNVGSSSAIINGLIHD